MIFTKDRKFSAATSNYREFIDPNTGVIHITVDFYTNTDMSPLHDWILYHNGIKELYARQYLNIEIGEADADYRAQHQNWRQWVRMTALIVDEKSKPLLPAIKKEDKERRDRAKVREQSVQQLEATRQLLIEHAEMLRQQNEATKKPDVQPPSEQKEVKIDRTFRNLILED